MSTFEPVVQPCPACGHAAHLTLARSLNVSRSPPHRAQLLTGELHRHTCTACGTRFGIDCAFRYLDFDRKQLFVVYPRADEVRWPEREHTASALFARNFTDPELPGLVHELGEGFFVRTVFGNDALREKVWLLEVGLDDVAVEASKLAWMRLDPLRRLHANRRPRVVGVQAGKVRMDVPDAPPLVVDLAELRAFLPDASLATRLSQGSYVDAGRLLVEPAA